MSLDRLVALTGVSILRSGNYLLHDVDWTVRRGENWVVFGPNGAGKTTLLQVASTYVAPSRGTVEVLGGTFGRVDVRSLRARIGYVGPAPASLVHAELPAEEIVVTGKHAAFVDARWHRYGPDDWARARELLNQLHAEALIGRTFSTLSAGERQRVMIARGLMPEPELLLLDEAASGLDLGARERLVSALATIAMADDGPAAVFVTHHVEEIPPGFDHILVLNGGTVLATGPIEDTLDGDLLSQCFETDIRLDHRDGRYRAWSP